MTSHVAQAKDAGANACAASAAEARFEVALRIAGSSKSLLNERAPIDRGPNNRDSSTARSNQADVASVPSQFDLPPTVEEMRNRRGTTPKTERNMPFAN